jgi:SAM-dependent methyltransferase
VEKQWLFDRSWTRNFTKLRQEFITEFLGHVRGQFDLTSAIDVGCGVGDLTKFLSNQGYRVTGVDGRGENVAEAKRRYSNINFVVQDAEDLSKEDVGTFDLVLCFGLLYHLENPFRAIRRLHSLTGKILLVETMCFPSSSTTMELLDEGVAEDQGLNYVAFYPSESCLVKMLYRAGFPFVYTFRTLPADELYSESVWRKRLRTFLVASRSPLTVPSLVHEREPVQWVVGATDPWSTTLSRARDFLKARVFSLRVFASRLAGSSRKE